MALPPSKAGALQLIVAPATVALALTFVGAPGAAAAPAVIWFDAPDAFDVPMAFVAVTLNVY